MKRVIAQYGSQDLYGASMNKGSFQVQGTGNQPDMIMDPRVIKKGIEGLKDEMKDLERETFLIEDNLERMRKDRILKN